MHADEQVECVAAAAAPPAPLARRILCVLLPGRLETRARAASSLPGWLTLLFAICAFLLMLEICGYAIAVIDELDGGGLSQTRQPLVALELAVGHTAAVAAQQFRLWVLPEAIRYPDARIAILIGLGVFLLLLGILGLVVLAPLATPMGGKVRETEPKTRGIVFGLGSVWLVQAGLLWVAAILLLGPISLFAKQMKTSGDFDEAFLILIPGISTPLLLLLTWLLRLMRAAGKLAPPAVLPLEARCGYCGYFLEGLAEFAPCPECGADDPAGPDRRREPSDWANRQQAGRGRALARTMVDVLVRPSRLFGHMQVLTDQPHARRFVVPAVCLSVLVWAVGIPGIETELSSYNYSWGHYLADAPLVAVVLGGVTTLAAVLVIAVFVCLIGLAIHRSRQEAAWPIAVGAGWYLMGIVPWIFLVQAAWLMPFFSLDRWGPRRIRDICWEVAAPFHLDWELVYVLLLIAPGLIGIGFAIRAAVVCYRHVRYACR